MTWRAIFPLRWSHYIDAHEARRKGNLIVMHDLQAIIDGLPGIYLIVAADADYTMVASSDERLRVTMTRREDVIDKPLFEVFSDQQPDDPNSGAATLRRSLQQVIATGQTQRLTQVR